ncbi:Hsp20 family protein [Streptomyces sp. ICBB 8177]|uniref:Hsp20 family protein n=1 Tax=Streptomyces sp. ICBB 8177 TaxID=563922 RepID=UPI001F544374|nr:Hsp20 family protein [Streptomyces sp. ICBB 8177]
MGGLAPAVAWTLLADVTESAAFHVEIELPGVKSKGIDVEASGQELVVTGKIKEKDAKASCAGAPAAPEPSSTGFRHRKDQCADVGGGVTVPKAEVAKPRDQRDE